MQKYTSDQLELKRGTQPFFELLGLKDKIKLLQDELDKREQNLQMYSVHHAIQSHQEELQDFKNLREEIRVLTEKVSTISVLEERVRLLEMALQKR